MRKKGLGRATGGRRNEEGARRTRAERRTLCNASQFEDGRGLWTCSLVPIACRAGLLASIASQATSASDVDEEQDEHNPGGRKNDLDLDRALPCKRSFRPGVAAVEIYRWLKGQ